MKTILFTLLLLPFSGHAQIRPPRIPKADREIADAQAGVIFKTLRAVNFEARKVAYPIYSGRQQVAYGISIGDGKLLTKASEVAELPSLFTTTRENESVLARLVGVYPENDLAVLEVPGLKAPAAQWANADNLAEGSFLVAVRADGEAQALGVLSVRERSLKSADQGFLGIRMDPRETGKGVAVIEVVPGSAASEVGIKAGDIITRIEKAEVGGFFELSNRLRKLRSGEEPEIELVRGGRTVKVVPTLKGRPKDERGASRRLQRMDKMSGSQSRVRGEFGNVLQSDMELEARDAGMPVVDLEGRIIGMVIARAGRISTLILPGDDIAKVLKTKPESVDPEAVPEVGGIAEKPGQGRRERMKRELELMRRLMENLERELEDEVPGRGR